MMLRLLLILPVLAVVACGTEVSGTYELVSIDGEELPVAWEFYGIVAIASGSLTLSDSAYEYTLTTSDRDGDLESITEWGRFTLDDANTICLAGATSSAPPPPPPPSTPGDTAFSISPAEEARAPRPEPDSTFECIGKWDGDQVTYTDAESIWVFRR